MPGPEFCEIRARKMFEMYKLGLMYKEIARIFNLSDTRVRRILRDGEDRQLFVLPIRKRPTLNTKHVRNTELFARYRAGEKLRALATSYGISFQQVHAIVTRMKKAVL